MKANFAASFIAALAIPAIGGACLWYAVRSPAPRGPALRVLAYSGFIAEWGPGPRLARAFERASGIAVEFSDGGEAGLLATKLKGARADAAIGFEQMSLPLARATANWRRPVSPSRSSPLDEPDFVAFDWSPINFVYRKAEIAPPRSLDDLLDPRFRGGVVIPDPRASSSGLQFLLWTIAEKGVDGGFAFLARLAQNGASSAPSWAAAYGLFQKRRVPLGFAYLTSPLYHALEEGDDAVAAAAFASGQPIQTEFVGIPESCSRCDEASKFVAWLRQPEAQRIIMRRNFMLPVDLDDARGTEFEAVATAARSARVVALDPHLLRRRDELFARWARTGM